MTASHNPPEAAADPSSSHMHPAANSPSPARKSRHAYRFIIAVLALTLVGGVLIACAATEPTAEPAAEPTEPVAPVSSVEDDLRERIAALETESEQKDSRIEQRDDQLNDIRAELDDIRAQLNDRDAELTRLQRRIEAAPEARSPFPGIPDVERFAEQIEADRLLLVEMRKELPDDRREAFAFWNNVKELAAVSDASLVAKANNVITALPAYFNFLETDFDNQQDAVLTFQLTGASDYETASDEFWRAFALSLIDRLTIVSDNVER